MNNVQTDTREPGRLRRRSFLGRVLAGGVFTLGGILNLVTRGSATNAGVTVRINPDAVPRTSHDPNAHG